MPTFNVNIDSQIESLTKSALAALVSSVDVSLNKIYIVTNATASNNKRIVVLPISTSALSTTALNLTDNTFGTYNLGTDIYTSLATVATSGSYNDLLNQPAIPAAQIQSDWNQSNNALLDFIKNKPAIPAAQVNSDWNSSSGVSQILNKPSLATVATSGSYTDLSNQPSIPAAQIQSDWNQSNNALLDFIKNKPTIPAAQVNSDWNSSSGVSQILNKPTIPAAQIQSDWNQSNNALLDFIKNKPTLATVATSGLYTDLSSKPKVSITINAGGSNITFQAGTTYYFSPSYAMSTAFTNQQSNFHKFVKGGTLKGFSYFWRTTQGNASLVVTIQRGTAVSNMTDTAATVTIAANSAAGSTSYASNLTINDGDFVTVKAVQGAGANAGTASGFFTEFEQQL